jgi:lipopolysaccharide transport system ATP-binding protein
MVDFAEMGQFVDTPVKHYSSGMYVRLAFAVAAHLEPEILLVDEVLAVGDASFQKKCLGKMDDIAGSGRTVVFVSHNMAAIENLCTSAYLLHQGQVRDCGTVDSVISKYLEDVNSLEYEPLSTRTNRDGNGKLRFEHFRVSNDEGQEAAVCGARTRFEITYSGTAPLRNIHIAAAIYSQFGQATLYLSSELTGDTFDEIPAHGVFQCEFDRFPLLAGVYTVNLYCSVNGILADWVREAARLSVEGGDFYGSGRSVPPGYGSIAVPHNWKLSGR